MAGFGSTSGIPKRAALALRRASSSSSAVVEVVVAGVTGDAPAVETGATTEAVEGAAGVEEVTGVGMICGSDAVAPAFSAEEVGLVLVLIIG